MWNKKWGVAVIDYNAPSYKHYYPPFRFMMAWDKISFQACSGTYE